MMILSNNYWQEVAISYIKTNQNGPKIKQNVPSCCSNYIPILKKPMTKLKI